MQGTIAKLMDKGFGFIKYEGSDKDLFFHANELVELSFDDLREGDAVTFEIAEGEKGPNAVQVKKADASEATA
jgi:CspA family cold shock protein